MVVAIRRDDNSHIAIRHVQNSTMADSLPTQTDATIPPHPSDPTHTHHQSRIPTGLGKEPLDIIILGASFAGLSCAHHFLDYTYSKLNTSTAVPPYRLVIVSPSTHIYWNIAAPRAIVNPDLIPEEALFKEIEEGFHRHRGSGTVFVQGEAVGLDLSARVVRVSLYGREGVKRASIVAGSGKRGSRNLEDTAAAAAGGKTQLIPYHALIMATGSSAHSELLSLHGTHWNTIGALTAFHARAAAARSIVVCGGGPSGVECAGQLATYLNYTGRGPFRRRLKNPKHITLITGGERCLPNLKPKVGIHAERLLKRLGVEIRHGVRVLSSKEPPNNNPAEGQTRIQLNDDTTLATDLYIPCTGVEPNSAYAPPELKDARGYIETHANTLRITHPHAGPRLYALGDVASYSANYVLDVYAAVPPLMHNLLNDLLAYEYHLASPYGGNQDKIDALVDDSYSGRKVDSQLCPISRFGGAGMLLGVRVPGWVVHGFKGRDYRVGKAGRVVRDGGNPYAVRGKYG